EEACSPSSGGSIEKEPGLYIGPQIDRHLIDQRNSPSLQERTAIAHFEDLPSFSGDRVNGSDEPGVPGRTVKKRHHLAWRVDYPDDRLHTGKVIALRHSTDAPV